MAILYADMYLQEFLNRVEGIEDSPPERGSVSGNATLRLSPRIEEAVRPLLTAS
jgi:hypothetical protein